MKSYSPELMIYPIIEESPEDFDEDEFRRKVGGILDRTHTLIIGPGLGRNDHVMESVKLIIKDAISKDLNLVIDGDGLFLVSRSPGIIRGYHRCVLTPSQNEYNNLKKELIPRERYDEEGEELRILSQELGNVTIIKKGKDDLISNGRKDIKIEFEKFLGSYTFKTSPRRCGGVGDVLSGTIGTFITFASISAPENLFFGVVGGSLVTKLASSLAFEEYKRGVTTSNIIELIPEAFEILFPGCSEPVD